MIEKLSYAIGRSDTNAVDSGSLPRHRWYPIKEGFSPNLVANSFRERAGDSKKKLVAIEPFSGSGTTPVECTRLGIRCSAFEINPFLAFVGRTKLRQADSKKFSSFRAAILKGLRKPRISKLERLSTFCEGTKKKKWLFNTNVLRAFTGGWHSILECTPTQRAFFRLALLRATMDNCNAYPDGKCLRYKRLDSYECFNAETLINRFEAYCNDIEQDLKTTPFNTKLSSVECRDSRALAKYASSAKFDLCVTSPPYLNSFDYSDVYRPELFLAGFVKDNAELMKIRLQTLRSHVQANWKAPSKSGFGVIYAKVANEIIARKEALWSNRIPLMIQAYFEDMERLLVALAARANPAASLKIAVATSAYAGVVVPVDLILAEIAERVGWELKEVQVVRRLRSSAQLWKHEDHEKKVPELRESIVILESPSRSHSK